MLEFALILPMFILLILGVLDLGRVAYAYNTIAYAARQGARYGAVFPTPENPIKSAAKQSATGLEQEQILVSVAYLDGTANSGSRLQVQVSYGFRAATPFIEQIWGGGDLTLRATSTMWIE